MSLQIQSLLNRGRFEVAESGLTCYRTLCAKDVTFFSEEFVIEADVLHVKKWKFKAVDGGNSQGKRKSATYDRLIFMRDLDGKVFVVTCQEAESKLAMMMSGEKFMGARVVMSEPKKLPDFKKMKNFRPTDAIFVKQRTSSLERQIISVSKAAEGGFTPFVHVGQLRLVRSHVVKICSATACDGCHDVVHCWSLTGVRGRHRLGLKAGVRLPPDLFCQAANAGDDDADAVGFRYEHEECAVAEVRSGSALKLFVTCSVMECDLEDVNPLAFRAAMARICGNRNLVFEVFGWAKPTKGKDADVAMTTKTHISSIRLVEGEIPDADKYGFVEVPVASPDVPPAASSNAPRAAFDEGSAARSGVVPGPSTN